MILCTFSHFTSGLLSLSVLFTHTLDLLESLDLSSSDAEGQCGHECSSLYLQLKWFV